MKLHIVESEYYGGYDYKDRHEMALNIAKWAFYEPLDPQELGIEDNLELLWDKYYSAKAGNLDARTDEDVFFSCENAEELAKFLSKSSVNTLRHIEIDLGIDEDTIKAENDYLSKIANESFLSGETRFSAKRDAKKFLDQGFNPYDKDDLSQIFWIMVDENKSDSYYDLIIDYMKKL